MQLNRGGAGAAHGFTLVELMVTVSLAALLASLAIPAFRTWISNAKVRASTEAVMSQMRLAQAEAVKRYRRVVLYRTTATSCGTTPNASAGGNTWVIKTIALYTGDAEEVAQCSNLSDTAAATTIGGPTAICFSTSGWPVAVDNPNIGGTACALNGSVVSFPVSATGSDRTLQVNVSVGGAVRMCDTAKSYSTDNPDGC